MKPLILVLITIVSTLLFSLNGSACTFDGNQTFAGTLTPTAGYQTQANVSNGDYFTVNVVCGNTYNFNFCNNGGGASWDTQITILNAAGTVEYAYNDDNCGLQSDVTWTAGGTGTIQVLVSQYSCNNTGGSSGATLAYNMIPGAQNASFTMASTGCATADATITGDTGGTFSFNPAPTDGALIDANTGAITNGTPGSTYTVQYTVSCGINTTQNVTLDATGSATFSMSEICGGGVATVTGSSGGVFSFNPNPGDGAQISSSTGTISNGNVGTTYFVEYSVCGNSSIESVTVLDDNCWTLNQSAQWITVNGEQCIQLTSAVNNQTGCAWNGSQIDFNSDFTLTLDYFFGTSGANGADGNTFTFQPSSSTACGTGGGGLGAGGILNALVVEFDTYDNDNPWHVYDMACDHIAVDIDGSMTNAAPLCGPVCAKASGGQIDDGGLYQVDIGWDASSNTLSVFFDGVLRLTCTHDFITNVFGGQSQVYWGATSATGGLNNQQYFCPSSITILPVELSSFLSTCAGDEEIFSWTTQSEENTDYFSLEYTYDGLIYYTVDMADAMGNTSEEQEYSIRVAQNDEKQRYYRLKVVDKNGDIDYTDLISGKNCGNSNVVIQSVEDYNSQLKITISDEATVSVVNSLGQFVSKSVTEGQQVIINKNALQTGVYFINVVTNDGRTETKKFLIN
jgi:hypothetical protein